MTIKKITILLFIYNLIFSPRIYAFENLPNNISNYQISNINYKEAKKNLAKGNKYSKQKEYKKALYYYKRAIEIDLTYSDAYNNLGYTYNDLEMHNEAILAYKKAIAINHKNSAYYNNLGSTYYSLEDYTNSIKYYKKAIELNPKLVYVHFNLGTVYYNLKRHDEAITYYKIDLDPKYTKAYNNLGWTYY